MTKPYDYITPKYCTQSAKWTSQPSPDSPDDVIEEYLQHLQHCPFHASLEKAEDRGLKIVMRKVKELSLVRPHLSSLSMPEMR